MRVTMMKLLPLLFFCTVLLSARCCASPEDDLKLWRERASKVKAGTPLAEVQSLLPVFKPTLYITMPNGTSFSFSVPDPNYIPSALTFSSKITVLNYYVAPNIRVNICYPASSSDKSVSTITFAYVPSES
jgi:hypothetical protein